MMNKPKMIKKPIKKNNIDSFKIYIEIIAVLKNVVRQHNDLIIEML